MASQQVAIAETVRGLKLALRRQRAASPASSLDSSADDAAADGLHTHSNRGNKLSASAQYVHMGNLDTTGGQARYKRKINHAGYDRWIVNKKPRLYDEDGDAVDPLDVPSDADEVDLALYGEPIEEDPFGGVRLETLLRPLTSAAALAEHPSLSLAYTSPALTQMASEAAEMVRREKAALWKAKRVLERFRGDGGFRACGTFETELDEALLDEGLGAEERSGVSSVMETEEEQVHNGEAMEGLEAQDHVAAAQVLSPAAEPAPPTEITADVQPSTETEGYTNGANGEPAAVDADRTLQPERDDQETAQHPAVADLTHRDDEDSSNSGTNPSGAPSHRMTTRARARSPQPPASPSPSPSSPASIPSIHPWFLFPPTSLPDRDLGLPAPEAEDTRKLLLLYVQKQENIVRQLTTLYDGLQRTDRLRSHVWRSCKAEGHLVPDGLGAGGMRTEMSDGEDWYDVQEWGIEGWELRAGRLEKGKDEVDDTAEEEGRRVGGRRRRVVGR
ncbi:hypothetical protein LTR53_010504 [Teratosphaeriaceae sp. CCFEE 6253]|nr:hypothetical protein LTR53_010504 [Teratosphaeriaceae sp. CCFEE 6253]